MIAPRIIAFCCNWCAYAGADMAGSLRITYSPHIRVVRVMCSGRVDPALILHCFDAGADGVMVLGCHPGDCHYLTGNERAEEAVAMTRELMTLLGIDERRLLLRWVSAAEGERFASIANEFSSLIEKMGPLEGQHEG